MIFNQARQMVSQWDGVSKSLCPICDASLVAKKGDIVRWHWAHYPSPEGSRTSCPYEESEWHLRWKDVYLSFQDWEIEYPVKIAGRKYIIDAINPRTKQAREFIHSLSPSYLSKHQALKYMGGFNILWIFDGAEFCSERIEAFKEEGFKRFLKPRAYELSQEIDCLVHYGYFLPPDNPRLFYRWKWNIWFPRMGEQANEIAWRFWHHMQNGAESLNQTPEPGDKVELKDQCFFSGCENRRYFFGIFCDEHRPPELKSEIKILPGYKCPECVDALKVLEKGILGCGNGHRFDEILEPECEP